MAVTGIQVLQKTIMSRCHKQGMLETRIFSIRYLDRSSQIPFRSGKRLRNVVSLLEKRVQMYKLLGFKRPRRY